MNTEQTKDTVIENQIFEDFMFMKDNEEMLKSTLALYMMDLTWPRHCIINAMKRFEKETDIKLTL